MSKNILVIGGLGFIGSRVVNTLVDNGHTVSVYDNMSIGSADRLQASVRKNVQIVVGDIRDPQQLRKTMIRLQPEVVIHMAAIHYIPMCVANPLLTVEVNITGTQNIIDAMRSLERVPKLIMTSSASVYGSPHVRPQTEAFPYDPVDIYGASKVAGEMLVRTQLTDFIILRLFNTIGENDPHMHLLPRIFSQMKAGEVVLGNAYSQRDYVYVDDVARAFTLAAESGLEGKTYNVGTGKTYSVGEVCSIIEEHWEQPVNFLFNEPSLLRKSDPTALQASISSINVDLGWSPRVAIYEAIDKILVAESSLIYAPSILEPVTA